MCSCFKEVRGNGADGCEGPRCARPVDGGGRRGPAGGFLARSSARQPGVVLYDRMVMAGAAAEGCRLLATSDGDAATCEEYVRRRLGAIPPRDVFHVHDSGCTWEARCEGGGAADVARVTVRTEVRPLPLLDGGATLLGMVNERGNLVVEVTATAPTRASWAQESLNGASVNGKAGEWRHEG